MRARRLVAIGLGGLLLGAAAPESAPVDAVRETLIRAARAPAGEASRAERLALLRAAARELVDTESMGRNAIGADVLAAQPPEAQAEFLDHFDVLIVRSWMQKLLLFRNPRFAFAAPEPDGDVVWVRSRILTERDAYEIDYPMQERDGRWWATDIVVEGLSLTESYQGQLGSLLEQRSFDELLELLRRKTRTLREADPQ